MTKQSAGMVIAAGAVLVAVTAQAATIHVDIANCPGPGDGSVRDPYCSIQTAIDNTVDTDEVVVAPGTYFEAINFIGKAITLRSSGGPEVTTIDGTGFFHVVQCVTGEGPDTVLDGFTITGGNANGKSGDSVGGGMTNNGSSPTVINCTFSGNSSFAGGGGMWIVGGSPTVTSCTFSGNSSFAGGGMSNRDGSSPMVTDCTFSGNSAESPGGGMFNNDSSPTVTNCTFSGNSAESPGGGGMYNSSSSPIVTDCTFIDNLAIFGGNGGGMYNLFGSSPTVTGCTFSGNSAGGFGSGGGMYNTGASSPTVTNCTFTGNFAGGEGGMHNTGGSSPMVTNCILWNNGPEEIFGPATVAYSDVHGGWPGIGNIDADPLFVDPDNGDYRLSDGSPCIDAGDNTAVPKGTTSDLDGNPRFVDDLGTIDTGNGDAPIVDMGAYEFQGTSCPWDCEPTPNGDVGINDFLELLGQWGSPGSCDFGGGGVGINDFLDLLANWGDCP
jgi:hypothetical protein